MVHKHSLALVIRKKFVYDYLKKKLKEVEMSLFGQLTKQKKIKNARSSKKNKSSSSKKIVMKKATFRI